MLFLPYWTVPFQCFWKESDCPTAIKTCIYAFMFIRWARFLLTTSQVDLGLQPTARHFQKTSIANNKWERLFIESMPMNWHPYFSRWRHWVVRELLVQVHTEVELRLWLFNRSSALFRNFNEREGDRQTDIKIKRSRESAGREKIKLGEKGRKISIVLSHSKCFK